MRQDVISISMENSKMGAIPSFTLLPGTTCAYDAPCARQGCYAKRMMQRRKSVYKSWLHNTQIAMNDTNRFKEQMEWWLAIYQPRAFRIHVAGDFFSVEYLNAWCAIATANPNVKFFAFTKQFSILRDRINSVPIPIPKNLSIILSAWYEKCFDGFVPVSPPDDLMKIFPVAWVIRSGRMNHPSIAYPSRKYRACKGDCESCGMCFDLKRKDGDVVFDYH